MNKRTFQRFLERDERCYHCGALDGILVPQHRIGRGMGGKNKKADQPANIVVLCSYANGLIESSAEFAELSRERGWKLAAYEEPTEVPIWDYWNNQWWILDNEFHKRYAETYIYRHN